MSTARGGARDLARRTRIQILALALAVVAPGPAFAADEEAALDAAEAGAADAFGGVSEAERRLEQPCTGRDDWIQLTTSEWLKGTVRRMRSREIDFWSREVKSRRIKWRKVVVLCMAEPARFATEGREVHTGIGQVRGDRVIVETLEGRISFPRRELLAILPGEDREIDRWGLRLGAGLDANAGNTEQVSLNANASVRREDRSTRAELGYTGTFGTVNGEENINRQRIESRLDYFLTKRLYFSIVNMPITYDKFQNLAARVSPASGLGWQVFDDPRFEWSLEGAIGYQYTQFISVPVGLPEAVNDALVRFGTELKWDIVSNLELKVKHETSIVPTAPGLTNLYTRAALKYEITWLLKLETAVVHNRVWEPIPNFDGVTPEPDDVQIILGFTLDAY